MAWKGSFIKCSSGSKVNSAWIGELYTPVVCGKNGITDTDNVQWAISLSGRFLYQIISRAIFITILTLINKTCISHFIRGPPELRFTGKTWKRLEAKDERKT